MPLQIRNPRARELARRLAERRGTSMTGAVIDALEAQWRRENQRRSLAERLNEIAADLKSQAGTGGRDMSKEEVDEMWGHS